LPNPSSYAFNLSLSSNLLSQLNPRSFAFSPIHTPYDEDDLISIWESLRVERTAFVRVISSWTRLRSVSFVDCSWLASSETTAAPDQGYRHLSPKDIPELTSSIALSWSFTNKIGGYSQGPHGEDEDGMGMRMRMTKVSWRYWTRVIRCLSGRACRGWGSSWTWGMIKMIGLDWSEICRGCLRNGDV
jgi:hypothetical protein